MELLLDNKPPSKAVKILNSYSRANIKAVELNQQTVELLKLKVPLLSSENLIQYPMSIFSTLASVSGTESILYGATPTERAQTSSWVEISNELSEPELVAFLESKLLTRTFLVSNHITLADIIAYVKVQKYLLKLFPNERLKFVCVMRWMTHLQSLPGLSELLPKFTVPQVESKFDKTELTPYTPQLVEPPKKDLKEESKQPNKAKKKPPKKQQAPPAEEADPMAYIDIRVGYVEEVWRHPQADKLFCETINLGDEKRNVVSGLVDHVAQEDFKGSLVVVLCNLKKGKIRGVVSEAMVLAGKHSDKVELLRPPAECQPGDKITVEGIKPNPPKVLPEKKKYWETVTKELGIVKGVACYKGTPLLTPKGPVSSSSLEQGTIS